MLFYLCIIPLKVPTLGVVLVNSEVGDRGLQTCVICRFSIFYLLNYCFGEVGMERCSYAPAVCPFPPSLNYWKIIGIIVSVIHLLTSFDNHYSTVHRLHCGCGKKIIDTCEVF